MRLGSYPCKLSKGSLINKIYGSLKINERHRHRYEVNTKYIDRFEKKGFIFSGMSPDNLLPEIVESKKIKAISITEHNKSINLTQLAGLINKSSYIIANDTGPAHMAAHLGKKGIVIFGYHTTPEKVSIETDNYKAITVDDLEKLSAEKVYQIIKEEIKLIN